MQETRSIPPSKNPPDLPVPGPRRAARVAVWIATFLWLFVFAALFFHHSAAPVLFGRFSKSYALGLFVLLLLTPAVYFLARAVFSPSVVTRADGTTFVVSPLTKVPVIGFATLLVFGLAQLVFPKRHATDAIDLDADVVLGMHAINDLHVADRPPGIFRRDYGHFESIGGYFLHPSFRDRTRLIETIRFFSRYVAFSDFRRPNDWEFHVVPDPSAMVRNLRSIAVLGRSRGQHVVLCTQPNRFRLDVPAADLLRGEASLKNFFNGEPLPGFVWFCRYMKVFNDEVRSLAAEEGLPLLDLERDVPPTGAMFLDDVHVTAAEARLEAELAAPFLADYGLLR